MRESGRSRKSLLSLMIIGRSLLTTAAGSTSKMGLSFAAGYFGNGSRRIAAFSVPPTANSPDSFTTSDATYSDTDITKSEESSDNEKQYSPWNHPGLAERAKTNKQAFRSRQHVNPLAKKFQQPTTISKSWPRDIFEDLSKPIFLDIGCSRGGFLIEMANRHPDDYNYLGLEIRPIVVYHANERVEKHNLKGILDFVGCNANIDLERLLTLLTTTEEHEKRGDLKMVTIQFPDPHFKARHAKRRVVTPELVKTLARFMPPGATVFLQSDVQSVLDEMRIQFRDQFEYFEDTYTNVEDYLPENIFGVPTEREISVMERNLPVYRATFKRTNAVTSAN